MKIPAIFALISCAASLLLTGCASNNGAGAGTSPTGYSGSASLYPMNQAARTDAMRQDYRNQFR